MKTFAVIALVVGLWVFTSIAQGQYFGTNKPSYKRFDYSLYRTPHFELYHYFSDSTFVKKMALDCEKWYYYHQQLLLDTFYTPNPVILYANHADFQQTSAINSSIDIGTGGVTEGMKNRVVLPVAFLRQETDHVLGHELVHAFQFHIIAGTESLNPDDLRMIPLWMIEGMAEYLSVGNVCSHTAMWMRDALIHHDFPSLDKLSRNYRYSPYRFGHSFWAYIASVYGEQYISRLFRASAQLGYEQAIHQVLGISADSLSFYWGMALRKQLLTQTNDSIYTVIGDRIISKQNAGAFNISPSVSPDGQRVIFMSERDIYSLDLFVADAKSGQILKKIFTSTRYDEIDALSLLETSGTWSPDSRRFCYVGYVKGETRLIIFDLTKDKIIEQISISDVDAIASPSWSPDGRKIIFSGLKNGQSDLYLYNLSDLKVANLTNSSFSDLLPSWSSDGKSVVYTTDEPAPEQTQFHFPFTNIAVMDLVSGKRLILCTFDGAKNTNPLFISQDRYIVFLSDRDGRRNLFGYSMETQSMNQLTRYPTGISGLTEFGPALTVCGDTLLYTMLTDGKFSVYRTTFEHLMNAGKPIACEKVSYQDSRLMPFSIFPSMVETNLFFRREPVQQVSTRFYPSTYQSKFKLDYIGNMSAGVMTGRFGTGIAGSIEAVFSDMVGNHMLYNALSINGEVYDFGGQIAYMNQKSRLKKGVSFSHIPYRSGSVTYDSIANGSSERLTYLYRRTFEDKISTFAFFPFNRTQRIELGLSHIVYHYRDEVVENVYSYDQIYYGDRKKVRSPEGFQVSMADLAFVVDNSKAGLASPVEGKRIRLQTEYFFGGLNLYTILVDYRKYILVKPYSLAFRIYHYGRYGIDSDSRRLASLFLGFPWFVRGYETGSFYGDEQDGEGKISLNQLIGSRIMVANAEWRIPFSGPPELAMIRSETLFSELAIFADAGLAWSQNASPVFKLTTRNRNERIPVFSTGIAYRINVFGTIVVETYLGFPVHQNRIRRGNLGINLFAGW